MELYERIRNRREELGLSQDDLAKKLGYKSRSTINKIELGINDVTQSKIVAIANALDTTPAFLMGWTRDMDALDKKVLEMHPGFVPGKNYLPTTQLWEVDAYEIAQKFLQLDDISKAAVENAVDFELKATQKRRESKSTNNKIVELFPVTEYEELACAGTGNYLDYSTAFITQLEYEPPKGADFIVKIAGHSMEPLYNDGDRVFIHKTDTLNYGDIGIFYVPQDGLMIKEYAKDGLVPKNEKYPTIKPDNNIKIIGSVIGKVE